MKSRQLSPDDLGAEQLTLATVLAALEHGRRPATRLEIPQAEGAGRIVVRGRWGVTDCYNRKRTDFTRPLPSHASKR